MSSSPARTFKVYHLSSSPAPLLNGNVKTSPNASLKDVQPLPSPHHTSGFPSFTAGFTKSDDLMQVSLVDLDQSFKSKVADRDVINSVSIDKCARTKNTSTRKSLKGGEEIKKCIGHEKSAKISTKGEENSKSGRSDEPGSAESRVIIVDKPNKSLKARPKKFERVGAASNQESQNKIEVPDGSKPSSRRKKNCLKIDKGRQTQLLKGKVTKPLVSPIPTSKCPQSSDSSIGLFQTLYNDIEVGAIRRRRAWTPPKINDSSSSTLPAVVPNNCVSPDISIAQEGNNKKISGLLEEFVYTHITNSPSKQRTQGTAISKRKLIDLVKSNSPASGKSKTKAKEKAPTKKARTLTEISTSIYVEDEDSKTKPKECSQATVENPKISEIKTSGTPSSSTTLPKRKSRIKQTPKTTLLSPESALREVSKQDFVFGTSSQLAREESPGFLKDLHEAMQASNQLKDPFCSSPASSPATKAKQPKRNLWNAASRGSDGSLLNVELVVLSASPSPSDKSELSSSLSKDPFHDIDDKPLAEILSKSDQPSTTNLVEFSHLEEQKTNPFILAPKCAPTEDKECSQKIKKQKPRLSNNLTSNQKAVDQRPNFESFTNAQLAKEISKYHFKPVKKREEMISLLQQCWEGKQRMKLGSLDTNTKIISTIEPPDCVKSKDCNTLTPTRTKKSTRKISARSSSPKLVTSREISDSESSSSLQLKSRSPKRSRKKSPYKSKTSATTLSSRSSSKELSPASSSRLLFSHITQAIKNTTPSKEAKNPNWNEKILLYDPIVLEDLTVWLNTGALQKTNWDGEVEPKVVKKWCDSKSICCLWRENLKGAARDRY